MSLNNYESYHTISIEQIRNYCKPYIKDEIIELSINLIQSGKFHFAGILSPNETTETTISHHIILPELPYTYLSKVLNDFYLMSKSNYDFVFHKSLNKLKEFYYENFT
jgi:hypothetical protein